MPSSTKQLIFEYPTQCWYEYNSDDIFYIIQNVSGYFETMIKHGMSWQVSYSRDVYADLDPWLDEV